MLYPTDLLVRKTFLNLFCKTLKELPGKNWVGILAVINKFAVINSSTQLDLARFR